MKYVLTQAQFSTLLALCGITGLYTFSLAENLPQAELIRVVHTLYQAGIAAPEGERLMPAREIREMFTVMEKADSALQVTNPSGASGQRLLYPAGGDEVVVLERCLSERENAFKLCKTSAGAFFEDLLCNELDAVGTSSSPEDGTGEGTGQGRPQELLRLERIDVAAGAAASAVTVQALEGAAWLQTERAEESIRLPYSEARLWELFLHRLEGDDFD